MDEPRDSLGQRTKAGRANQHTHHDETDDRRDPEPCEERNHNTRCAQDDERVAECFRFDCVDHANVSAAPPPFCHRITGED